jgi:putative transposase
MDITYIPMKTGFMYLAAVDWYSRYVLAWELSNTLGRVFLHSGAGTGFGNCATGDVQH